MNAVVEDLRRRSSIGNGDGGARTDPSVNGRDDRGAEATTPRVAAGLGWFSFGLGTAQLLAPGALCRLIGVDDSVRNRWVMRSVGVRELAAWWGILRQGRADRWLWGRVAGDVQDLALLGAALADPDNERARVAAAFANVAGVTVLDLVGALRASRATQNTEESPMHATAAVTVKRPTADVYAFWHDLANLPRFMTHVESVRSSGNGHWHWVASTPLLPKNLEWDAEIVDDVPNRLISWRTVADSSIPNSGSVRFAPAPGGRGTEVTVDLEFHVPGGRLAELVARMLGEEPVLEVKDDLRRFKQVMETGEIIRSDGSPDGAKPHIRQRPAQPLP
ncbi:MAG: SRPBCC family protein [Actinobacteria bacterium]|nr:SRPBCC family protein [Actinomycetota bacterium]